jgi:hypothetical protein
MLSSRTLTIISVVTTLISLVLTILMYYGVCRYYKIKYVDTCKDVCEKYLTLPRVNCKSKVVVAIYNPKDLATNATIKSILDQTVHPDQIVM